MDGRPARVVRVNGDRMGVVLEGGTHRVVLAHHARGLAAGLVLAGASALGLALAAVAGRRRVV